MSGNGAVVETKPAVVPAPDVAPAKAPEVPKLDEATFTPPAGNARQPGTVAAEESKPKPAPVEHHFVIGCGG